MDLARLVPVFQFPLESILDRSWSSLPPRHHRRSDLRTRDIPSYGVSCARVVQISLSRFVCSSNIDFSSGWHLGPGKDSTTGSGWSGLSNRLFICFVWICRTSRSGWLARRRVKALLVMNRSPIAFRRCQQLSWPTTGDDSGEAKPRDERIHGTILVETIFFNGIFIE